MMIRRPVILILVAHYLPAFRSGGPVRAIENLVNSLGGEFTFRIICRDRDALDTVPYPGIPRNQWITVGKAQVYYIAKRSMRRWGIQRLLASTEHEVLYINSLFDIWFSIVPLLARRCLGKLAAATILAPRGELSPGALSLKWFKKRTYLLLAKQISLFRGVIWQSSNSYETDDIRRAIARSACAIVEAVELPPQGGTLSWGQGVRPRADRRLRLLYLARISRDKNLLFCIQVLKKVKAEVVFDIAGPIREPDYWEACQTALAGLPNNIEASYIGEVEHSRVAEVYAAHDLLFMPTVGENYGYVIPEAMSVGTPVLISDRSGWRNLIGTGGGWDLPLEQPDRFVEIIEECAAMCDERRIEARRAVESYYAKTQRADEAIAASRALFVRALAASSVER